MARLLIALTLCCLTALPTVARSADASVPDPARIQALREQVRTDKKKLVTDNLPLTAEEAARFWPLYEQYGQATRAARQRFNQAMLDFVAADATLSNANATRLVGEISASERELLSLRQTYFKKLAKAIPPAKAARYLQIEAKIDALVRFDQAAAIPLAH